MAGNLSQPSESKAYKRWTFSVLFLMAAAFLFTASLTIYRDPFFHYHAPLAQYSYPQERYPDNNERYLNDGIMRHFSYNAIITGTSVTENFKASEAERLFDAQFIKVPFAGAKYKEIDDNLQQAYRSGRKIRYVIRSLDNGDLILDKDAYDETFAYPDYLYNDNPFDDISYVLNKSVLLKKTLQVKKVISPRPAIDFDTYANWNDYRKAEFGAPYVLASYRLRDVPKPMQPFTDKDAGMLLDNLRQNVTKLAYAHPETTFYLFFPPYSICYWDILNNEGTMERHIDAERLAIEELLQCPNIKLYSFSDNFALVCNLDNYNDYIHYGEWVNSQILQWIKNGEHLLTKDNYQTYLENIRRFYHAYDYASLRA